MATASGVARSTDSINSAAGGNRPDLLDAVAADADTPVAEADGRGAMAEDQADLVAESEPVMAAETASRLCSSDARS